MTHRIQLEVDQEIADELTLSSLKVTQKILQESLAERKAGQGLAYFHIDIKRDVKALKKMLKAINRVIKYMSPSV